MTMADRATYVSQFWDKVEVYFRPGLVPPLTFEATDEETGDPVLFTRIADDSLRCLPATVIVKDKPTTVSCDREECHRKEPGVCQCGLHPAFTLPDGSRHRGVKLSRAT